MYNIVISSENNKLIYNFTISNFFKTIYHCLLVKLIASCVRVFFFFFTYKRFIYFQKLMVKTGLYWRNCSPFLSEFLNLYRFSRSYILSNIAQHTQPHIKYSMGSGVIFKKKCILGLVRQDMRTLRFNSKIKSSSVRNNTHTYVYMFNYRFILSI